MPHNARALIDRCFEAAGQRFRIVTTARQIAGPVAGMPADRPRTRHERRADLHMSGPLTYVVSATAISLRLPKGAYALQAGQMRAGEQPATGSFHHLYDEGFMPEVQDEPDGPVVHPNIVRRCKAPCSCFRKDTRA